MRIAVCAPLVPFARGGAEIFADDLVAETINPLSPLALRHYFADLTHAQPLVPETLELLARQSGFAQTELRFLNEPADRLTEPDDPVIAANVRRLNELLFAPLDYALVARTAADA